MRDLRYTASDEALHTGAFLATPFLRTAVGYQQPNYFNSGRFEARLKQPVAHKSWSTFWLWHGSGVNEIDITESVGHWHPQFWENKINTHAWGPDDGEYNPLNLPRDSSLVLLNTQVRNGMTS
jgi:hypothetical protein